MEWIVLEDVVFEGDMELVPSAFKYFHCLQSLAFDMI